MRIKLKDVFDTHVHFRGPEKGPDMQRMMVQLMAYTCAAAVAEPNTEPPILTGEDAVAYRDHLMRYTEGEPFVIIMAIKLNSSPIAPLTTPEVIYRAHELGVKVAKLYPLGTTTGAMSAKATGVVLDHPSDIKRLYPAFRAMEEVGMVLQIHAQMPPPVYCFNREHEFVDRVIAAHLIPDFDRLKRVVEHASTAHTIDILGAFGDVGISITPHHELETTDYVMGGGLNAAGHCMPQLQSPMDRDALAQATVSFNPLIWYGSDKAPHFKHEKMCLSGCPGVFHGPYALPLLACAAEHVLGENEAGIQAALQHFTSDAACTFYNIKIPFRRTVVLERTPKPITTIPKWYPVGSRQIPLFWGGKRINWRIAQVIDE